MPSFFEGFLCYFTWPLTVTLLRVQIIGDMSRKKEHSASQETVPEIALELLLKVNQILELILQIAGHTGYTFVAMLILQNKYKEHV